MIITSEIIKRREGPGALFSYIDVRYPNGVELDYLLEDVNLDHSFLHWLRLKFDFSDKNIQQYCNLLNIKNSNGFWASENIIDSENIVNSNDVNNSKRVFNSVEVCHSSDIVRCENISNSSQIFDSFLIEKSSRISNSKNVNYSTNVLNSNMIINGKNINDSKTVFNSSEIIRCENIQDSYFCEDSSNIRHCLFCKEISNAEYQVFNKPVEKQIYEFFENQYKKLFSGELKFVAEWPADLFVAAQISLDTKFENWYSFISERFWNWTRTLPNFDSMLLYDITMQKNILIEHKKV